MFEGQLVDFMCLVRIVVTRGTGNGQTKKSSSEIGEYCLSRKYFHCVRVAQGTVAHCVKVTPPTSECQYDTALAVFTVICVVWRLHIVTWCAQATVFSDTTRRWRLG